MKKHLLLTTMALTGSTLVFAGVVGNYKFSKTYSNSAGPVTFLHEKHAERFIDDCGFCHSALETFGGSVDKLFAHKICLTCHESHNGPTACGQCHNKT